MLGGAVAKAVFKVWFKDSEFLQSAGDSLVDLVAKVVPDWRAKSAAVRQLERITERAAERFEPYLGYAHIGLSDDDVKLATEAVAAAIEAINPNSKLLAEIEYNPSSLAAQISAGIDHRSLGSEVSTLAAALSEESAELIVDLSSAMPDFHRDSFSEVLKRESFIIDRLDNVFAELDKIREHSSQAGSESSSRFEQYYRRTTARNLDQLELFGLDANTRQSSRQHNLTTAYISLSVASTSTAGPETALHDTDENPTMRAEEAAAISPFVVIKGEAGSGKTTLLQSLAVRAATASFGEEMSDWNDLVPFFIRLRALTNDALPRPEEFPALVAPSISGMMPQQWVQ